ncbi:MAG: 3-dehydroquinate synthase II [Desulfobacteraceae bacterium]|jgi:3-dehydroquinate synthase II|nr:MAG: 3-dehydroquinate synthase II [Desulfobacteraceae bacterium]
MKVELWVNADPWDKALVTTALEGGAEAVIVPPGCVEKTRSLGRIRIVSEGGDLEWGKNVLREDLACAEDEQRILALSKEKLVIVRTRDWRIIPLENLVARSENILVEASGLEDAGILSGILEKGVKGILVLERDPARLYEILKYLREKDQQISLEAFYVEDVRSVGMGDRVCVDTCTLMGPGEGLLVGNTGQAFFLVQSECLENPYVSPRPFRVNAGPVHAYVKMPGDRTSYLSELKCGDVILKVDHEGNATPVTVGRVKIERRPMLLIELSGPSGPAACLLQNAETVHLIRPEGGSISAARLNRGDHILGGLDSPGRHFGHRVKETILEK